MSYYASKPNKYPQIPDVVLDFHGMTTTACKLELEDIIQSGEYTHIRIIPNPSQN